MIGFESARKVFVEPKSAHALRRMPEFIPIYKYPDSMRFEDRELGACAICDRVMERYFLREMS